MTPDNYYTRWYRTEWPDCDNVVIGIYEEGDSLHFQQGIVEVKIYKRGEHKGEALVWNLNVNPAKRRMGLGRKLMSDAYDVAMLADCHTIALEWSEEESPQWVAQWYARLGYEEKEFSTYALMKMEIIENKE